MDYLEFIDATRDMNPQQRGNYFNQLTDEERSHLVDQAGDIELIMIHSRMMIGAEAIDREPNAFKKRNMTRVYDALTDEYTKLLNEKYTAGG
jgi:hypothetical protein